MPSRDFQLHFCQSLAGLSNEGSVDQGDSSHSLQGYMHEDPPHQKIGNLKTLHRVAKAGGVQLMSARTGKQW